MPGHDGRQLRGEISEIQSATGKGDWETISNTSTTSVASSLDSATTSASPTSSTAAASPIESTAKAQSASRKRPEHKYKSLEELDTSSADKNVVAVKQLNEGDIEKAGKNQRSRERVKDKATRGKSKDKQEVTGRTTLEEYFHQQSKLFSNVEKRYNAFQQKVKDEKERQRSTKTKGRK
jgi:hypothetical protein